VIVGGMSLGTLFTLFIIPVAYTYIVGERQLPAESDAGGAVAPPSRAPAGKA
jgi:multidrug efflux pump